MLVIAAICNSVKLFVLRQSNIINEMNKTEFIKRLSERLSLPPHAISCFLDAFHEELANVFKEDNRLIMQGMGAYSLWNQAERNGHNPKTGEKCVIPARKSIRFRPGKGLLEKLNQAKV